MQKRYIQDLILEKINDLNKWVEMLSRETHVNTTPGLSHQWWHSDHRNHPWDCEYHNQHTTINQHISDTLVASNTVPTRAITLQLVVSSASLTTASPKSARSLISVAYSSVSHTQSPPLIPAKYEPLSASTAGSLLLCQQGASTTLIQEHI